jgi:hypothetical protein
MTVSVPPDYGLLAAHAPSIEKAGVQADFGDNSEPHEKKPTLSFESVNTEDVIKEPSLLTQPELALAPNIDSASTINETQKLYWSQQEGPKELTRIKN